jgi:hypothetical protein
LVKYGFRAILPDFDVQLIDGNIRKININEGKIGFGIRIEDDLYNMTRQKSVNEIINTLRESKDPYNDKRYSKT